MTPIDIPSIRQRFQDHIDDPSNPLPSSEETKALYNYLLLDRPAVKQKKTTKKKKEPVDLMAALGGYNVG